jgi:hypothetical protein
VKGGVPCLEEQALAGVLGEVGGRDVPSVAAVAIYARGLWDVDLRQAHVLRTEISGSVSVCAAVAVRARRESAVADRDLWQEMRLPSHGRAATRTSTKRTTKLGFFAAGAAADTAVSTAAQSAASIVATTLQVAGEVFCAVVWITKYGWIYKITIWITVKKVLS